MCFTFSPSVLICQLFLGAYWLLYNIPGHHRDAILKENALRDFRRWHSLSVLHRLPGTLCSCRSLGSVDGEAASLIARLDNSPSDEANDERQSKLLYEMAIYNYI